MIKKVKRGEVYIANLSPARGSEQFGIRPVVIIQNDKYNGNSPTTIVAPVTSSKKNPNQATHVYMVSGLLREDSIVLLEQIRTIDKSRLIYCIGNVSKRKMRVIDKAIKTSLGIKQYGGMFDE